MKHNKCDIDAALHFGPFWVDEANSIALCDLHRDHYVAYSTDLRSFTWVEQDSRSDRTSPRFPEPK